MCFRTSYLLIFLFGVFIGYLFQSIFNQYPQKLYYPSQDNSKIAYEISNNVRILCFIMTTKENHKIRAVHVKSTWAKRCTKFIFMSNESDADLDSMKIDVPDGREFLWEKTKKSIELIYHEYLNDYDWFLKTDDDTYVILENLRLLLLPYSSSEPLVFGCKFKFDSNVNAIYNSGGAGYVLSRESVKRFVEQALPNSSICSNEKRRAEDVEIAHCLKNVGAKFVDSRDVYRKHRFNPFRVPEMLTDGYPSWFRNYSVYRIDKNLDNVSDFAITFHYISSFEMYVYDYLIYHLQPFGVIRQLPVSENEDLLEAAKKYSKKIRGPDINRFT